MNKKGQETITGYSTKRILMIVLVILLFVLVYFIIKNIGGILNP